MPKQQVSNDDNRFSSFPTLEDIGFIQIHSIEQDHQEQELNRHLPFILFASVSSFYIYSLVTWYWDQCSNPLTFNILFCLHFFYDIGVKVRER